jgi:hypothetical protein
MPSVYAPQRRRSDRSTGVGSPPIPASLPAAATVILEGLITSCHADGSLHLAAMGPEVAEASRLDRLVLKPFAGSRTAELLAATPEGVFHLTDDVLLLARVVTGSLTEPPATRPAEKVRGWLLKDACEAFEFRIVEADTSSQRARLSAEVVASHSHRPFRGSTEPPMRWWKRPSSSAGCTCWGLRRSSDSSRCYDPSSTRQPAIGSGRPSNSSPGVAAAEQRTQGPARCPQNEPSTANGEKPICFEARSAS